MEIHYSSHFLGRKVLRNLPEGLAEDVFLHADDYFHDTATDTFVAVKRAAFHGSERDIALVYRATGDKAVFVTMHPLQEGQKERRIQSRRWVCHEPESPL